MKKSEEIKKFYQQKEVVNRYLGRRFAGVGGGYVNTIEINSIVGCLPDDLREKDIIDLGSGTGRITLKVLGLSPKSVTAVDASETMLNYLKEKTKKVNLVHGYAEKLPLKSSSADFVLSLRLIEHLEKGTLNAVLKEVCRVLKPGAIMAFNTVNPNSLEALLLKISGPSSSDVFPIQNSMVKILISQNGFSIVRQLRAFIIPRGIFLHLPSFMVPLAVGLEKLLSITPLSVFSAHIVWHIVKNEEN